MARSGIVGSEGELAACANGSGVSIDPQEHLVNLLITQFALTLHYPILRQMKVLTYQSLAD